MGTPKNPVIRLTGDQTFQSPWKLETVDLGALREAIGRGLFDAFVRAFVLSDRLSSLAQLMVLTHSRMKAGTVARVRNVTTLRWLILGTLRETAQAIGDLQGELAKRGWLDTSDPHSLELREFERRWKESVPSNLRNQGAFHVDLDVVTAGVEKLASTGEITLLAEGDGPTDQDTSLEIGSEALLQGLFPDTEAAKAAFESVDHDNKIGLALQKLFVSVTDRANVECEGE